MELDIRPLTPDMLDDYMDFFDNVAFSDNPSVPKCYCGHFHWNAEYEAMFHRGENPPEAPDFVRAGIIQGYLAYRDGSIVGWCNANDKLNYDSLKCDVLGGNRTELWNNADNDVKIKSVVCFLVAPAMRGYSVATCLLERVCADAKSEGYVCVEGYPLIAKANAYANHHGPMEMFLKFGFKEHKRFTRDAIMRLYL